MFVLFKKRSLSWKHPPQKLPLTNIKEINRKRVLYTDSEGHEAVILCKDAHKRWRRHKKIRISAAKYVCDRTRTDDWKLIFYTDPQITFYIDPVDEQRWIDILNRLTQCGCPAFDWD